MIYPYFWDILSCYPVAQVHNHHLISYPILQPSHGRGCLEIASDLTAPFGIPYLILHGLDLIISVLNDGHSSYISRKIL